MNIDRLEESPKLADFVNHRHGKEFLGSLGLALHVRVTVIFQETPVVAIPRAVVGILSAS